MDSANKYDTVELFVKRLAKLYAICYTSNITECSITKYKFKGMLLKPNRNTDLGQVLDVMMA